MSVEEIVAMAQRKQASALMSAIPSQADIQSQQVPKPHPMPTNPAYSQTHTP